jgi:hypothetical protein
MATANLLQTSVSGGTQNALSLQGDGVFFPKASTASRLALTLTTTDKGFVVYDTTDSNIYFWNGTAWESIPGSGDAGANGSVQYNDNGIVSGATNFIYDKVTGNVGLGTASPTGASGRTLEIYGAAGQARLALKNDATGSASTDGSQIALVGSQLVIQNREASEITFETSNSERYRLDSTGIATWSNVGGVAGTAMTLNSTGLGVGVTPQTGFKITTNGNIGFWSASRADFNNQDNTAAYGVQCIGTAGSATLNFVQLGVATRMSLDASGNLGIGVTPSAWNSSYKAIEFGSGNALMSSSSGYSQAFYLNNAFYNTSGNYFYKNTQAAVMYQQNQGTHQWFNAPSGTAGASAAVTSGQLYTVSVLGSSTLAEWQAFFSALTVLPTVGQVVTATATGSIVGGGTVTQNITFTRAMSLDASGRLLVGSTASGTAAGDGVVKLGGYGHCISQTGTSIASGSSIDLTVVTSGAGYQGFLSVANTQMASANTRTQTTYSVFGRGTASTITQIATANGSLGGASFTVTTPSNGVIRITNTSGAAASISAQFFGGASA